MEKFLGFFISYSLIINKFTGLNYSLFIISLLLLLVVVVVV